MADKGPHILWLYPTEEVAQAPKDGKARKWTGATDDGIAIDVWISTIRVADEDVPAFERTLGAVLKLRPADTLEDAAYQAPREPLEG